MEPVTRHIEPRVEEALGDTRIVVIQGARQVGKTTLLEKMVDRHGGRLESFDDVATRQRAVEDPMEFLSADPDRLLAIDEVQRVPELILSLKYTVDRDKRPGRFLLTGSADLLRLPAIEDSLAGRTESLELHGFSQGELDGHRETFIDRVLAGDRFTSHESELKRADYLARATAGGYPEALARTQGRRRDRWLDNYVANIVTREADDLTRLQRVGDLPMILRVLAARNSGVLNAADVARDTEIPVRTLSPYLELLQTLYLTQHIPAWATNLAERVVRKPKVSLLDTGLAARLINISAKGASQSANPDAAGNLLEGFIAGEIRRQLTWSDESARLGHFSDPSGGEVDLVIETPDGRVVGLEVKATSSPSRKDVKGLTYLRNKLGNRFVAGLVLHTGAAGGPFGERIAAVPMDVIWTT